MSAIGKQRITNLASAVGLTIPAGTKSVSISVTGANVRYWLDGSTPTAAQGQQMFNGGRYEFSRRQGLDSGLFIQESASAVFEVTYFDRGVGEPGGA